MQILHAKINATVFNFASSLLSTQYYK